ncbi:MAG: hypothetical protein LKF82_10560 [Acinetobacter populi]|jgi:hypothetical protein|uniref:hypothetical protein n=1 Tax=Acinetobacter populi TaxID=1582270 RepID=UPI00235467FD|nr:hypothetical protein [Acinetobacter populi]MCH4248250.1 hypothetical protein [Acinetobacter populi]
MNNYINFKNVLLVTSLMIGTPSFAGLLDIKLGGNKENATGAAAGSNATGNSQVEKCESPLGTLSIIENQQAGWYTILTNQYRLPPSANLLKLYVQQSNCFILVERSFAATEAINRERELMNSGELRSGSNFGKGQMVAADYSLSPEINFSESNTGGVGGAIGGLLGGTKGSLVSAVAGGLKRKEASTLITLFDNRSSVQISASEGTSSKYDFGGISGFFGGSGAGGIGGYTNTPQGKVLSAAFLDSYNQMVRALRNYKAQQVQGGLGKGGTLTIGQ